MSVVEPEARKGSQITRRYEHLLRVPISRLKAYARLLGVEFRLEILLSHRTHVQKNPYASIWVVVGDIEPGTTLNFVIPESLVGEPTTARLFEEDVRSFLEGSRSLPRHQRLEPDRPDRFVPVGPSELLE